MLLLYILGPRSGFYLTVRLSAKMSPKTWGLEQNPSPRTLGLRPGVHTSSIPRLGSDPRLRCQAGSL